MRMKWQHTLRNVVTKQLQMNLVGTKRRGSRQLLFLMQKSIFHCFQFWVGERNDPKIISCTIIHNTNNVQLSEVTLSQLSLLHSEWKNTQAKQRECPHIFTFYRIAPGKFILQTSKSNHISDLFASGRKTHKVMNHVEVVCSSERVFSISL